VFLRFGCSFDNRDTIIEYVVEQPTDSNPVEAQAEELRIAKADFDCSQNLLAICSDVEQELATTFRDRLFPLLPREGPLRVGSRDQPVMV